VENISVFFPITFLTYVYLNPVMRRTNGISLATVVFGVLAVVIAPALVVSASADPAPKQDESCSDEKFADRDSCPGKSEDSESDKRDDDCVARNKGQSDEDCTETVNPPND
jgi:hypothetical protein